MITETGKNLSVLILTEPDKDWETFSTWYSFYKNVPDAKVSVINERNKKTPFAFYQWAKRLQIRVNTVNQQSEDADLGLLFDAATAEANHLIGKRVLFVRPLTMATDLLDQKSLDRLNQATIIRDSHIWFMNDQNYKKLIDDYTLNDWRQDLTDHPLCFEAKDTEEPYWLVTCSKGCGKWINTAKGCPFSSAGGLVTADMTANESRINNLWRGMVTLYNAVV